MSTIRVTSPATGPGAGQPHPTGGYDDVEAGRGSVRFRFRGELHRLDGPALMRYDAKGKPARIYYYRHGKLHREDGPAVEKKWSSGSVVEWHFEGSLHRLDGPARTYFAGDVTGYEWWVRGTRLEEDEFGLLRSALDAGSPFEWALAYAQGSTS